MVIWLILDEAHIGTIAIAADYRRRDWHGYYLGEGLLISHTKGAVTAYLEVRRGNLGAQELISTIWLYNRRCPPRYYKDNHEDALLLTLQPIGCRPDKITR